MHINTMPIICIRARNCYSNSTNSYERSIHTVVQKEGPIIPPCADITVLFSYEE